MNKNETLEAAKGQTPFEFLSFENEPEFLKIDQNSAVIYYGVTAKREGAKEFRALISTTYTKQNGEWKIIFHHQTHL
jgi:hypothetical protein